MNAYDQALRINRELKRENDELRNVLKEVDEYILRYVVYNIDSDEEDRQLGRIQHLITEVL
jgi:hypothetical protein